MKHTNDVNNVEEGQNVNTLSEIEEYYIGFGWETGLYSSLIFAFRQIFFHHCFNEVQALFAFFRFVCLDIAHLCS